MQTHEFHVAQSHADDTISLAHVTDVLKRYRPAIAASLVAVAISYVLLSVLLYLFGPAQQITSVPFRLVFDGADAGKYPNGTDFSTTEITATPTIQKVYTDSGMQRFGTFAELKSSIFVIERNKDLARLALEYDAKLADPKIYQIDRERIEREYDLKKGSIRHTDFALSMAVDDQSRIIPAPIRVQVLKSILDTWADQAMNEKGAGRYRIPVLSRNILEAPPESRDYLIAIDILRTKVNRIIGTIDQMLGVRGAEVLTTGKERITLTEVRANLEDTRRFRLEPLIATIRQHQLSTDYAASMEFLQSQLETARRKRDQERARVNTLQRSLELYTQRNATMVSDAPGVKGTTSGAQVIQQVDKSFLDQLSDLISQKRDIEYRQKLVDNLNVAAINQLLPAETEVSYYESLVQSMKSRSGVTAASPEIVRTIQLQYQKAMDETFRAADQVSDIYRVMSKNLNPGLTVYTLTDPVEETSLRAFSLRRLLVYGILTMIVALPLILFGVLLHNRIREESALEQSMHRFTEAESEVTV